MKLLITGADGFIGAHMVEHVMAGTDWPIVALCSWRQGGVTERLSYSAHVQRHRDRLKVITHDLTAPVSAVAIESLQDVDAIVHFAANSNVDQSITDPPAVIRNNVEVTVNTLELARAIKPAAFVQISTDEVYGPAPDDYAHKEWDPLIPSNPYAASKAAQECIATSYWRTYGVPVILTQTMNNIGERQSADKFLPMIIRTLLGGGVLQIHAIGDRVGSRYYMHARNHADAVCFLLHQHTTEHTGPTFPKHVELTTPNLEDAYPNADRPPRYHVVGEREIDNLELAQMVAKCMGMELDYQLVDAHTSRPGHDLRYALDGSKLEKAGWVPPVPLIASLEKTVAWYVEHPEWLEI